jgi:hypothetical protein
MNSNDCQTHKIYITARLVQKWYSDMRWYIYIYIYIYTQISYSLDTDKYLNAFCRGYKINRGFGLSCC